MSATKDILLVDDYDVNRIIASKHLESVGYRVDVAVDGSEAMAAIAAKRYDLVLMDIEMPVLDGWECTRKIRILENEDSSSEAVRVPIIAMSGHVLESDTQRYRRAGMDDCLAKPVERAPLLAIVEKWLDHRTQSDSAACSQAPGDFNRSGSNPAPVDMEKAIDEFLGDRDMVVRLLGEFIRRGEAQMTTIENALGTDDFEKVRLEAHALKGGAANLTAYSLADSCAGMETAAETAGHGHEGQLSDRFTKLQNEFERLKVFFNAGPKPTDRAGVS
jgi:CheY-like chemotaxis protein/HPt (histidine-containing phosphotransfer) domain-containing protein